MFLISGDFYIIIVVKLQKVQVKHCACRRTRSWLSRIKFTPSHCIYCYHLTPLWHKCCNLRRLAFSPCCVCVCHLILKINRHNLFKHQLTGFSNKDGSCFYAQLWPISVFKAMLWLHLLVADISLRRPWFDSTSVHVRYSVNEVAVGRVFIPVLLFPSQSFHQRSILTFV